MEFIIMFSIGGFVLLLWLVPFILIMSSARTRGGEKVAWLLLMLFVSWFAWIFYLVLAPLNETSASRYHS
ncbi:hypothetical protein [Glaciecola sp.]|jgi:hypothetical protein|uniref:hypothetical protein n=1 Tax=Glaciecola sp. MF2-115 TaxID=3384827 RepID=UPI0039895890